MAKIDIIIPFLLHSEAGLHAKYTALPYQQMYDEARRTGFANDPTDKGGATLCGITLATYTAYRTANRHPSTSVDDLKAMTFEEWRSILRLMFWNRWQADQIECQAVANALVDWLWTSGKYGITLPQKILKVKADGIVGELTLAALNNYPDQHELFDKIQAARLRYHQRIVANDPKMCKYIKGWQRRVRKITWQGFIYD